MTKMTTDMLKRAIRTEFCDADFDPEGLGLTEDMVSAAEIKFGIQHLVSLFLYELFNLAFEKIWDRQQQEQHNCNECHKYLKNPFHCR